jgi:hypothetical protein
MFELYFVLIVTGENLVFHKYDVSIVSVLLAGHVRKFTLEGQQLFALLQVSRPALGPTQPPTEWVLGMRQLGCIPDHSPPSLQLYGMHEGSFTFAMSENTAKC